MFWLPANLAAVDFRPALVATDLDGTLWGRGLKIHPASREALDELERRAIPVLAATGRRPRSALQGFERNDLLLPSVLLDGTLGEDFPAETRFHEAFFSAPSSEAILAEFLTADIQPCVYVDHPEVDLLLGPEPTTDPTHLASVVDFAHHGDLELSVPEHSVLAFTLIGVEREAVAPLAERINRTGLAEATLVHDSLYGRTSISVIPPRVSKWNGVAAFCAARGIDPTAVLAIGDAGNDLGMLEQAGHAVAPRTAEAEVLAVADSIIDGPDDGGWAAVIDFFD